MSTPCSYYGKASHMVADLLATARRVRAAQPSKFEAVPGEETRMREGKEFKVRVTLPPQASSPTGADLSYLARRR